MVKSYLHRIRALIIGKMSPKPENIIGEIRGWVRRSMSRRL